VDHNIQLLTVFTRDVNGWPDGSPFINLNTKPGSTTTNLSTTEEQIKYIKLFIFQPAGKHCLNIEKAVTNISSYKWLSNWLQSGDAQSRRVCLHPM